MFLMWKEMRKCILFLCLVLSPAVLYSIIKITLKNLYRIFLARPNNV